MEPINLTNLGERIGVGCRVFDVHSECQQQSHKEVVESEDLGRNRPRPRQLIDREQTDRQQAAANASRQPEDMNE